MDDCVQGWNWVDEGRDGRHKYGYVTEEPDHDIIFVVGSLITIVIIIIFAVRSLMIVIIIIFVVASLTIVIIIIFVVASLIINQRIFILLVVGSLLPCMYCHHASMVPLSFSHSQNVYFISELSSLHWKSQLRNA